MKILCFFSIFLAIGLTSYAQNIIDLTIRYNQALSHYEVFARPNFTQANFLWGSSQVSIVAPASVANTVFQVIPVAAGGWSDSSPIYAPLAAPSSDFHAIGSSGQPVDLTANQELRLFSFTIPGGGSVAGLQLFTNGSDPSSNQITMPGDFANVIYVAGVPASFYRLNYADTTPACNLEAPTLSK